MKNIFYVALLGIALVGCSTYNNVTTEGGFTSYGLDFRSYTNDGFLITTESPNGDYKTIGLIEVNLSPEVKRVLKSDYEYAKNNETGYSGQKVFNGDKLEYYLVEIVDVQKAIDEIYKISSNWGANAIFNLNINSDISNFVVKKESIKVTGLAVVIESD